MASNSFLRRFMPKSPASLSNKPGLRRLAGALARPELWRMRRRSVALGAAIGAFFAFIIPFGQIPLSVMISVLLRGNVPISVATTFINTPLTFGPVYYAAWWVGSVLLGAPAQAADAADAMVQTMSMTQWFAHAGAALLLGSTIFAVIAAVLGYGLVHGLWSLHANRRRLRWQRIRRAPALDVRSSD